MYLQITHSCFDFYSVQKVQKQKIHEANKVDDSDTKFMVQFDGDGKS